jgi:hypothetical protein
MLALLGFMMNFVSTSDGDGRNVQSVYEVQQAEREECAHTKNDNVGSPLQGAGGQRAEMGKVLLVLPRFYDCF